MGLGDVLKNLIGKEEKKEYKSPDVKFLDDEDTTGVTHTIPIAVEAPTQQFIIKHDGEYLVFNSLEDMPEELRNEIQHLDETQDFTHSYSVIVDGERKTYSSLEDMPEDIRKAINKE